LQGRGDVIALSLNEAETLSAKAARGAGYAWGQAEDIGRAARALAAQGSDFGAALLTLLQAREGFAAPEACRLALWRAGEPDVAGARPLCPVTVAAWLLDAGLDAEGLRLLNIGLPIWLDALLRPAGLGVTSDDPLAMAGDATLVRCSAASEAGRRAAVDPDVWRALNDHAARSYVPESESSRQRGAGGGRVDDD
jgi:hypothetical protein